MYETEWKGSAKSVNDGGLLIEVIPTAADASKVLAQSLTAFTPPATYAATHFTVQGIAGHGNAYVIPASSSSPKGYVFTMVFMVGRIVAIEFVELSKAGATPMAAQTIAHEEAVLLHNRVPSFSLMHTTRSGLGSSW